MWRTEDSMAKSHSPEVLASNLFKLAMAGLLVAIAAMISMSFLT